jgi:hypothetical protein
VTERLVLTVPYEIAWQGDTPMVVMAEIASDKIHATFWGLALERYANRTAILKLDDVVLDDSAARFVGAIHHITRCGSTTLLQQFGALYRTFALSEPLIFYELLGRASADSARAKLRVQKLTSLFGKGFAPIADQIIVKWPTLLCRHAQVLNEAIPHVPSVLIVRNAIEILASIEARPLGKMENVMPQLLHGPDESPALTTAPTGLALTAKLLAANCRWIAQSKQTRLIDYTQLPDAGWLYVAPIFGITPAAAQIKQMQKASGINAKQPDVRFVSDTADKRRDASPLAQSLANDMLQPAIDEARAMLKSF